MWMQEEAPFLLVANYMAMTAYWAISGIAPLVLIIFVLWLLRLVLFTKVTDLCSECSLIPIHSAFMLYQS